MQGTRGVLWTHELYEPLSYNQDRAFFHSFPSDVSRWRAHLRRGHVPLCTTVTEIILTMKLTRLCLLLLLSGLCDRVQLR